MQLDPAVAHGRGAGATAYACGCRIKPFETTRSTLGEVHFRAAVHDVLATNRLRATDEMAVFGTHPYKRSGVLARSFPTTTPRSDSAAAHAGLLAALPPLVPQASVGAAGDVYDDAPVAADRGDALAASGSSANAIAFPSGSGIFT
jgi:hypothetical protein